MASPRAQLVPVPPLLAMVLSLIGMLRRIQPSLTAVPGSRADTVYYTPHVA